MDFNEFLDRVTGVIGNSDVGQVRRALNPNLDRQFRAAEQRNMQRAAQRAAEEELRRQREFLIGIFATFESRRGFPLQLHSINNHIQDSNADDIVFCDENSYNGINVWWRCDPEPDVVRKIFKNITSKTKFDVTWDDFKGTLSNAVAEDLWVLLKRGIKVKSDDRNYDEYSNIDIRIKASDAYKMKHKIAMNIFKKNYVKCYNADNGIQSVCFVTTAVCDSFGKSDDCFELTTFRNFRDTWLTAQPDGKSLIAEYYAVAPKIVAGINRLADAAQIYKNIWQKYLEPCLDFIRRGDNSACKKLYVEMVQDLKRQYL